MKSKILLTILIAGTFLLHSCGGNDKSQSVEFFSANINDVKRRVEVSLSSLVESLEITQLEDQDGAFSRIGRIYVTENYIGIRPNNQDAFKLFDRQGRFIGNVGTRGQGPGEYASTIYHTQICEKAERVYLVPWANANRIMTYNLQGQYLPDEDIPFAFPTKKVVFYVDNTNNHVVVMTLPFQNIDEYVVWVQDFEGNAIQKVSSEGFAVIPDFSNEIYSFGNTPNFDFQRMKFHQTEQDTLYHYDVENNVLRPVFTFEAPIKPGELIYSSVELPRHFLIDIAVVGRPEANPIGTIITAQSDRLILVDKETQEVHSIQLRNDFLGDWVIDNPFYRMHNGYFTQSMEPMELKELLDEALKRADLQPDVRQRITELNRNIDFNGNDVLMIGKLKQNPTENFNEVEFFEISEAKTESIEIPWSDDDTIHQLADTNPEFEGGYLGPLNFFIDNLIYPEDAKEKGISRSVMISAVIEKNGSFTDTRVLGSGIQQGMVMTDRQPAGTFLMLENEAIRVFRLMPKAIKPATIDGKAVRVRYIFFVPFSLD
jgi:hypothetical protein